MRGQTSPVTKGGDATGPWANTEWGGRTVLTLTPNNSDNVAAVKLDGARADGRQSAPLGVAFCDYRSILRGVYVVQPTDKG